MKHTMSALQSNSHQALPPLLGSPSPTMIYDEADDGPEFAARLSLVGWVGSSNGLTHQISNR